MSDQPMSREQLEALPTRLPLLSLQELWAIVLDTDAALRAQLEHAEDGWAKTTAQLWELRAENARLTAYVEETRRTFGSTTFGKDLQAQVTALEQVRDEYYQQWMDALEAEEKVKQQLAAAQDSIRAWIERYTEAERQLAAMTQEREDLIGLIAVGDSNLAAMTQERDTALLDSHALLAASEARVKALEEVLNNFVIRLYRHLEPEEKCKIEQLLTPAKEAL